MDPRQDKLPKWYQDYLRKEEEFWNHTYLAKTWEEKVQHWTGSIHEMMRSLSSSGGDEYEGFNPLAYEGWKESEPRIDEILALFPERLPGFDVDRMWRGIRG